MERFGTERGQPLCHRRVEGDGARLRLIVAWIEVVAVWHAVRTRGAPGVAVAVRLVARREKHHALRQRLQPAANIAAELQVGRA